MKNALRKLVEPAGDPELKKSVAREYLQARILQLLQDRGAFTSIAFLGGTALRFLYNLPRYSEDLDFSYSGTGPMPEFRKLLQGIKSALTAEGYAVTIKLNDRKTVMSAFIRFESLLYDLGISPLPAQVLSVKLEVDTNPPDGAMTGTTLVRRYVALNLYHYDRASLLAGKIRALLCRPYAKGRDIYDLVWYLADRSWPTPNFTLLNAALHQTGWEGPLLQADNWKHELVVKLQTLNWKAVQDDVRPFLEQQNDVELVRQDTVLGVLR